MYVCMNEGVVGYPSTTGARKYIAFVAAYYFCLGRNDEYVDVLVVVP